MIIYALSDSESGEVRYVGRTSKELQKRVDQHINQALQGKLDHRCNWIRNLLDREGFVEYEVLEECENEDVACWAKAERKWIAFYNSEERLTNLTSGGEKYPDFTLSQEVRDKISASRLISERARLASQANIRIAHAYNKGKKHTTEHKAKIGLASVGRFYSEETRMKMSLGNIGKKRSPEAIARMVKAQTGKKLSEEHKIKIGLAQLGRKDSVATIEQRRQALIAWYKANPKPMCNQGHVFDEKNTGYKIRKETGLERRFCKACARLYQNKKREEKLNV